jgi:hypothetical protein
VVNIVVPLMLAVLSYGSDHNTGTKNLDTTGQESQVLHLT